MYLKFTLNIILSIALNIGFCQNSHSLEFGNSGTHVEVPFSNDLNLGTGDFTLEVWIKADASQVTYPTIISNRLAHGDGYFLGLDGNGYLKLQIEGVNYASASAGGDLRDNTWHHLAVTRSNSNVVYYVDGIVHSQHGSLRDMSVSSHALWFGWDDHTPSSQLFNGLIDEVRIWNIARDSVQINNNMTSCLTGSEPGLMGYWQFNEGSGTSVADATGNGHDGTLMNNILWKTDVGFSSCQSQPNQNCLVADYPFNGNANDETGNGHNTTVYGATLTSDRFGNTDNAYSFDGTNDYIDITNHSDITQFSEFTLSAWVYPTGLSNFAHTVISKVTPGRDFNLKISSSGTLVSEFHTGTFYWCFSGDTIPLNEWTHTAASWDGDDWRIYINGQLKNTCNQTPNSPPWTGGTMSIGALGSGGELFKGNIDEVKVFSCALSDADIQDLAGLSDSCQVTVYDTVAVNVYDTIMSTIIDTLTIYDSTSIVVFDTTTINLFDTTTVLVYDTVAVTDTLIIDIPTGLPSPDDLNTIKVYPNPTTNLIFIDNGDYTLLPNYDLKIINTLGQQFFSSPINVPSFTIDLSQFAGPGVYLIQILDGSNQLVEEKRIILQ